MVKRATAKQKKRGATTRTPVTRSAGGTPRSIAAIVREQVEIFGSQRKFAQAFGISESRAGKLMREGHDGLTLFNLLSLAKMSGYSPYEVLEAAGKSEEAELLYNLFGAQPEGQGARMSPEVRDLASKLHRMPGEAVRLLKDVISSVSPT